MKIEVNVTGLDPLVAIIERLTILLAPATGANSAPVAPVYNVAPAPAPVQQVVQAPPVTAVPAAPVMQAPPVYPDPANMPAPVMGSAVPVTAQTYSMEQLAVAATQINDAGRRDDLINLLRAFGVEALTQLPKEHYGAFATRLREMGAKI